MGTYNGTDIYNIFKKHTKKSLLLAVTLMAGTISYAQQPQKIDPTVEVQKDFDSKIPNIHKSRLNTSIPDSLSSFNLNFNYSIFNKPYRDLYEFSPLPSAQIQSKVKTENPIFLAKLAVGYPLTPDAGVWFQPRMKGGSTLQFNALYNAFYGKLPLVNINNDLKAAADKEIKASANNSTFGIGGRYGYSWNSGELSLALKYKTSYNTYYGFVPSSLYSVDSRPSEIDLIAAIGKDSYMKENFSHRYNQIGASFSINSIDAVSRGAKINYNLNINYLNTSDKLPESSPLLTGTSNKLNENLIQISGEIGPTFGKYNKFTIGFNSENVLYGNIQDYKYGLYEITPQYSFEKGRLKIKAGVKISGRYKGKDETDTYHNTFFAKAGLSYEIAKNSFWIYANLNGGNYLNAYSSLLEQNRWVSQNADLKAGSIPLSVNGGFRGQVHNKFSYNFYARYTVHEGLLQYITAPQVSADPGIIRYDSRLYTAYSNHREFTVGTELAFDTRAFTANAAIEYSSYTKAKKSSIIDGHSPFGYAPLKCNLGAMYNYRERIYIGLNANIRGAAPVFHQPLITPAPIFEQEAQIKAFCNLALKFRYVINPVFSVFATGENLLDSHIQYYPQYIEKGISFNVGVLVKL